jgi:hypothetical protein
LILERKLLISQPGDLSLHLPQIQIINPGRIAAMLPMGYISGLAELLQMKLIGQESYKGVIVLIQLSKVKSPSSNCSAFRMMNN